MISQILPSRDRFALPFDEMDPRISIIIPCYNDGATLPETLDSVFLEEDYSEIIVVDDGSDDPATLQLFVALEEDPRVTLIHQPNRGLPAARMAGVAAASAPYIFPLDADDCLLPGSLSLLADALDRQPKAGVAWGDFTTFGEREVTVKTLPYLDPWLITYTNTVPVASLVRRQALEEVGGWSLDGYEDWDLWMALAEHGWWGVKIDRPVFHYRIRRGRMHHRFFLIHGELMVKLGQRHQELFRQREVNRQHSPAPRALKLLYPWLERWVRSSARRNQLNGLFLVTFCRLGLGHYLSKRLGRELGRLSSRSHMASR